MLDIAWKTYTQYDVYEKCDCVVITQAKVRNHNLRGLENEMTMKVLNFIEKNKRSGWQLAPLREKVMNGSVHGC